MGRFEIRVDLRKGPVSALVPFEKREEKKNEIPVISHHIVRVFFSPVVLFHAVPQFFHVVLVQTFKGKRYHSSILSRGGDILATNEDDISWDGDFLFPGDAIGVLKPSGSRLDLDPPGTISLRTQSSRCS